MRGRLAVLAAMLATPAVAADAFEDKSLTEIAAEIASGKISRGLLLWTTRGRS
jgi:hypothetical protein